MKTKKITNSLQDILKNRQKSFGRFCTIAGKSSDLSLSCQSQPMIDERLMAARAIINTPREDREGDIIVPKGVHLENFRKNPVVLWEHGLGKITHPIAKCQHPDGNLALEVEEDQIIATSYFTDKVLDSLQIFHLITEGLVRATSVRAVPIKSSTRKTSNDGIGVVLEEWELIEWSWGALGVNPDAIARTIDRGTIEGHKITEPLLKSLKSVLAPTSLAIPGWDHSTKKLSQEITQAERFDTAHEAVQVNGQSTDHIRNEKKAIDKNKSEEVKTISLNKREGRIQTQKASCQPADFQDRQCKFVPLGAQILKSIHCSISELSSNVNVASISLENENVKSFLKTFLTSLEKIRVSLERSYLENYPYLKSTIENKNTEINDTLSQGGHTSSLPLKSGFQSQTISQKQVFYDEKNLEINVEKLCQAVAELQQKLRDLLPA